MPADGCRSGRTGRPAKALPGESRAEGSNPSPSVHEPWFCPEGVSGVALIAAERERQMQKEGWTVEHDAGHIYGEMAEAAAVYVRCALTNINPNSPLAAAPMADPPTDWPWEDDEFRPAWSDPIRTLTKAGALIAAEIDRLSRIANSHPQSSKERER